MFTDWIGSDAAHDEPVTVVEAPGFPPPRHPAEADLFVRHEGVPGHAQATLELARAAIVGAGGLGSWVTVGLARSGIRSLTIIDHDRFDRSNASRQLTFGSDIGHSKAAAVARNVAPHLIAGGTITAISLPFETAIREYAMPADLLIVLVDNNACRREASRLARLRHIPVVFSMLSTDSMRVHTFVQGPADDDACLWCALPNLDPESVAPCASAVIASCFMSAAHVLFFAYRALMGWPSGLPEFNWRSVDLQGANPEQVGLVGRRHDCAECG